MKDQLSEIATQLEEQLKFYRDLGVDSLGGSERTAMTQSKQGSNPKVAHSSSYSGAATIDSDPGAFETNEAPVEQEPDRDESSPSLSQPVLFGGIESVDGKVRPRRSTSPALPVLQAVDPSLESIREDIGDCTRCRLHERRTNIVFGEGNPHARLVFVGEGPGSEEDVTGRPFVGRAGQLLDKIIEAIGSRREEVYIANIVKCRPPGNRTPERDEVATCEPFLFRQLAVIKPEAIVALGSPAFQCLMRTRETITRARGEWKDWNGIRVMPTFHPAYLLRSPDKKRETWEDMKKVRDYLASRSSDR
jgi:uracil-DNA glycosylase family 4